MANHPKLDHFLPNIRSSRRSSRSSRGSNSSIISNGSNVNRLPQLGPGFVSAKRRRDAGTIGSLKPEQTMTSPKYYKSLLTKSRQYTRNNVKSNKPKTKKGNDGINLKIKKLKNNFKNLKGKSHNQIYNELTRKYKSDTINNLAKKFFFTRNMSKIESLNSNTLSNVIKGKIGRRINSLLNNRHKTGKNLRYINKLNDFIKGLQRQRETNKLQNILSRRIFGGYDPVNVYA